MNERTVQRLRPLGETIFATIGTLVAEHGAANLGQGAPAAPAPPVVLEEARRQIAAGNNNYPPARGIASLREAICDERQRRLGERRDPATECLVTVGATEGITATILGLVEPGAEVVLIEPFYDCYRAAAAMAGAKVRTAALVADEDGEWRLDADSLRAAVGPQTAMIVVNSPHNPTGAVLSDDELAVIAEVANTYDTLVLSDEVYEHLVFDGLTHKSISSLPGMAERTVVVSSAAKTFNITGWKIGWALGPRDLIDGVIAAKQFMTCVAGAPFQPAVARGLLECPQWIGDNRDLLRENRDHLMQALRDMGITAFPSHAGYFVLADAEVFGLGNAMETCMRMPAEVGVGAIPVSAFVMDPDEPKWRNLIRLGFCCGRRDMDVALDRITTLTP
ncbi:aminotransferase class I/II-fold pyridoxal phosphate-dependent enzyme [Corynebacterium sp. TAE3-ERU12]|uniref:aminotransferase class I/II-fold pyridoxal phosphate-dependent enzyme n=1 Tax=Corynebacterium sp. TAE3-ERU12 TaxID=2849491 RepID=UPI001C448124|nr:aminotransferase class I/II-fold pyridoxal phosphate-dependent enzyme [Corynebacterium sp. TAE3-ERU12]MBV7295534.1 aminotransferase class I/II-fold pyridoxal phosphate-dependent enzyme [Corynebacterium sp. TAE3-ERU12]